MSIWYAFFSYAIISCLPVFVSSSFNFCNYGEYFKNNKCYVCEEDSYSSHRNSESCFSCPPSSFNKKRTSKFIYDCTCDNNYYLDYVGNRCDLCSYINNHFYCKKNLNELHVDNLESFFKHKNEISFKNFDRCSVKQKKKNIYPFMNNMYIYCKRPYVCLDTCGKCAEKNEGFICNNCIKNYYKNIYVKYAKCKKCYHIIFIIFITMIYCILSLIFFMVLFKCINISLYFYHFDIYEKGTIYFLHYFREFMFYLSLILLLSFSNDLTENERENYTLYEKENKGGLYLHKGNLKAHYFLNIYLHNAFYDLIKIVHLNFLHFIKLDCFHFYSNRSKIYMLQILVFVWIVFLFTCFTLVFNFIFLYLRKGAKNMILEERGNKSESLNNNKIKRIKKYILENFKDEYIYPLFLPNYTFHKYVNAIFFYNSDVIDFFKTSLQIYYYQYIHITLYIGNSSIMFIFLSSYICIGLFNYNISYYDTSTVCYDELHLKVTKLMGLPIISCFCFLSYLIIFISIFRTPRSLKRNYKYKYMYGFYTFLCKQNKYYYYILKILLINILFLCIMRLPDHLSFLIFLSFFFLFFICLSMFVNPHIKVKNYNIKLESFFFMFLFFLSIQLEQLRIITYHIVLRIILSFSTLFIYTFILLYYLYFMLRDVFSYFSFYAKYVRIKKDGSTTENRENMDNSLTVNFYFYYYLKNKMNVNLFHFDEGTTDFSKRHIDEVFLKNYEVVTMKPRRAISKKDIGYIYHSCVLISPFIAETIIQLLFITKNINHIIRLRTNNPHVKIYNFLFENGYIEIQKTAIDRFITKAICIYKQVFKGNYFLFRSEMISVFTDIVRNLRCFKDVYIRECIANRIREKYKINEVDKNKMIYDENYEQKHINTFLYKLRRLDKNVDRKNQEFFQLFPNIGHVVLKKVNGGGKKKKRRNA
ncbi:conserved Plasmodium protein, unknown function [Plasmodium malariae]|uniref:Tyrosine-protein kinase ephrin type A/B receptor-like domain-containing protein n=1 Tax=Plasmodium malariae TaxID=5858 RepID=A0A1D3RI01_PLAMA|nr:conserved Plasmodium protein, unknown function [Plasmodium malariae]SCN44585.1 conserved Plasmodium protein, unknown function [Plasmodium malariae]